ncbi:MAG: glycoside hydrolase family 130 protein [Saprospiraceae bacterium]|nr:glycoside hydrolase family 130 protein [Saprospiraceae bacterium]
MKAPVKRKDVRFFADSKKVIARYLTFSPERAQNLVDRILEMPEPTVATVLSQTLREFAMRHRSITRIFEANFNRVKWAVRNNKGLSNERRLLIGAYFTSEYSIESAAFFNPSAVESPDQTGLEEGQKRIIVSLRATGEGHISSIVFRQLVIDANNDIQVMPSARRVEVTDVVKDHLYKKPSFTTKLTEMNLPMELSHLVLDKLPEKFNYLELVNAKIHAMKTLAEDSPYRAELEKIIWLADSHYELHFSLDTDITERVIFPISDFEMRGIEDARFVKFNYQNGQVTYFATYCAYSGETILPKLIQTEDFYNFKIRPLHGWGAQNKNLALFPRKIKGKYYMLSRIDGVNNYIMVSDKVTVWEHPILIQKPMFPWEMVQMGNCGSPIETEKGWLLITHGVGPMRCYSLGASLLDLEDPTKEIGRLCEPLLIPNVEEREGYVPNVVYSCGSFISNGEVVIPYAMSDYASAIVTVPLNDLLNRIIEDGKKMRETSSKAGKLTTKTVAK